MQFTISTRGCSLTGEERAYVEFRVFSALRPVADRVPLVSVAFTAQARPGGATRLTCVVRSAATRGPVTVRRSGVPLYQVVDLAAARLAVEACDTPGDAVGAGAQCPLR